MILAKKGEYIIEDPDLSQSSDKGLEDRDGTTSPTEIDKPIEMGTPDLNPDSPLGPKFKRTLGGETGISTKKYKSKTSLGRGGNMEQISSKWERLKNSALSAGGISEKARSLIEKITTNKPKVNWERELRKFMDSSMNKYEYSLPNKRFLSKGRILYGKKKADSGTLKTLVLPIDTSTSISKSQIKVFLEEAFRLATKFDIDETIIIYCSDSIDNTDRVKKGGTPDLSKWATTGANANGFNPPFAWIQENNINPSAVIYLTDSLASYPSQSQYGINKYKDRVFWFICKKGGKFNIPPFGKYIHVPMDADGNFI